MVHVAEKVLALESVGIKACWKRCFFERWITACFDGLRFGMATRGWMWRFTPQLLARQWRQSDGSNEVARHM
eukprot:366009-Chlamydomonas_euryale.AAC.12